MSWREADVAQFGSARSAAMAMAAAGKQTPEEQRQQEEEEEERVREQEERERKCEGEKFLRQVMDAMRLSRHPSPRTAARDRLAWRMRRDMQRGRVCPGSFVGESQQRGRGQSLAWAYQRFGMTDFPSREDMMVRENRILRRKRMSDS